MFNIFFRFSKKSDAPPPKKITLSVNGFSVSVSFFFFFTREIRSAQQFSCALERPDAGMCRTQIIYMNFASINPNVSLKQFPLSAVFKSTKVCSIPGWGPKSPRSYLVWLMPVREKLCFSIFEHHIMILKHCV